MSFAGTRKSVLAVVTDPRFIGAAVLLCRPLMAQAYLGQTMIQGLYTMVGLPIMFAAFLWTLASIFFTHQHLSKALYSLLGSVVFTGLLYGGDRVMGWIQAAQSGQ